MNAVIDKTLIEHAKELFATSRERVLAPEEVTQTSLLLEQFEAIKSNRPWNTTESVWVSKLKSIDLGVGLPAATNSIGSTMGKEIEKSFNQAVPDRDAFLIHDDDIIEVSNPRKVLTNIEELATAIENDGRINKPLQVEKVEGGYKLVGGHRRRAANKILIAKDPVKWSMLPVRLKQVKHFYLDQILDNKHHEDLTPIEEAEAYSQVMDEMGWDQKTLAEKLSVSRRHVSETLSLLKLPGSVQTLIADGSLAPNGKEVKNYLDMAKKGKDKEIEQAVEVRQQPLAVEHAEGQTAPTKPSRPASNQKRDGKISINKDTAIGLCQLLSSLTKSNQSLIDIESNISKVSPKKDIIAVLEQRTWDVLEAYK